MTDHSDALSRDLVAAAKHVIAVWDLANMEDAIIDASEPCIDYYRPNDDLNSDDDQKAVIPGTKLGGFPELPEGLEWPTCSAGHIPFVAQVDLSAIPKLSEHLLPSDGLLYFFCWSTDEIQENPCRVHWHKTSASRLQTSSVPEAQILSDWQGVRVYEQIKTTSITWSLTLSKALVEQITLESGFVTQAEVDRDVFGDFPHFFAGEVAALMCSNASAWSWGNSLGYMSEDFLFSLDPCRRGYRDGDDVWIILLHVPAWTDTCDLIFLIRPDDLVQCNFDDVRVEVMFC